MKSSRAEARQALAMEQIAERVEQLHARLDGQPAPLGGGMLESLELPAALREALEPILAAALSAALEAALEPIRQQLDELARRPQAGPRISAGR